MAAFFGRTESGGGSGAPFLEVTILSEVSSFCFILAFMISLFSRRVLGSVLSLLFLAIALASAFALSAFL